MTRTARALLPLDSAWLAVDLAARAVAERIRTGIVFDPSRPELREDPYPFYRRLRERDPFHRSWAASGWVLSRWSDVHAALAEPGFSADERHWRRWNRFRRRDRLAGLPDPYAEELASLLRMDPPRHARLRRLVSRAFTPRAVDGWAVRIAGLVDELLEPVASRRRMELVRDFAGPLPVVVIAEILGVPSCDRERFRRWSEDVVRLLGVTSIPDARRALAARSELLTYLGGICAQRRVEPRDDLISALVRVDEDGERLDAREMLAVLVLLLVAGNETTTKLIGNGVLALLDHPEQAERLRADPSRVGAAVEELLRYDGPVQLTSRIVPEDREWRGHRLRRGDQLVLLLGAANRDPARFEDPDRLDVAREDAHHVAFGHGTHFCLGARLARLEARFAFEALLARFPELRRGGAPVEWSPNTVLRGPTRLELAW